MTVKYRTRGFIFKKQDRSEADQDFAVFTKDFGKIDLRARAIRKITSKLRADIDIFYLSEVEFIQGKNNKTLTDAIKINKFDILKKDFRNLKVLHQIANILDIFIKGQEKDERTFDLLSEMLNKLSAHEYKIRNYHLVYQYFFWNFISLQGYHLQVEACSVCHGELDPNNIYFSSKEGQVLCKKCILVNKNVQKINADTLKVLRLIFKKDWETVCRLKIDSSSQLLLDNILKKVVYNFCPT